MERKETPEEYKERTGQEVPKYMATYARYRTNSRPWNKWKVLPYHEAETTPHYYTEHEIILANSDFCPVEGI